MKLDLALSKDYCPSWGVWEGMRDIVQNYLDGADKGFAPKMAYSLNGRVLTLINEGANLPREAMLIGFSSKRNDDTQRGQYGEGLKIALLALTRAGLKVTIRSGGEKLTPRLEWNKKFGAETLCVEVTKCEYFDGIKVNVWGLDPQTWTDIKSRFLPFRPESWHKTVFKASSGAALLAGPEDRGKVYAAGIYVCDVPGFEYGFDIPRLKVDRDRRLPDSWDLKWETSQIIAQALHHSVVNAKEILEKLQAGKDEVSNLSYALDDKQKKSIAASFKDKYGPDAVPVSPVETKVADQVKSLGGVPVVVNNATHAVIGQAISASQFVSERSGQIEKEVPIESMPQLAQESCRLASSLFVGCSSTHAVTIKYALYKVIQFDAHVSLETGSDGKPSAVVTVPTDFIGPPYGRYMAVKMAAHVAEALVLAKVLTFREAFSLAANWKQQSPPEDSMEVVITTMND
jgi:hypothetical protein